MGAGSLLLSHVNDAGIWLFGEYFSFSVQDTHRPWPVLEALVGLPRLGGFLHSNQLVSY